MVLKSIIFIPTLTPDYETDSLNFAGSKYIPLFYLFIHIHLTYTLMLDKRLSVFKGLGFAKLYPF